jgi:hypothetical protein
MVGYFGLVLRLMTGITASESDEDGEVKGP